MKLKKTRDSSYDLSGLQKIPAGPARLLKLLRILENDLSGLPLDANSPPSVIEAHSAFTGAVAFAKQTAAQVEEAEEAVAEASKADVAAAVQVAEAGGAGKLPEPTRSRKAAGAVDAALLGCAAAEKHVGAAHEHLVDAVQKAWPAWRRDDVARAEKAHGKLDAALAAALDAARVLVARRAAVLTLDHEMLSRDPALHAQVSGERRPNAVAWYQETHIGSGNFQPVAQAIDDLAKRVAVSHEFPAADWLPPEDPGHDELLATDVDAGRYWLHSMAQRETTATCSVCNRAPAEVAMVIEGKWWTVCKPCAAANAAEQTATLDKRERQAKAAEHGVDPNASYSVDGDGSHHPA